MIAASAAVQRGFPGGDADGHLRTIPTCAALGLRQPDPPTTWLDPAVRASRAADGRFDRGAALVLADQATAAGVFATLDAAVPMMTLDLRVDWFGALPEAALACVIDDVVREGDLAYVRGHLASGEHRIGGVVARFLIGGFPGGGPGTINGRTAVLPPSEDPDFATFLDAVHQPDGTCLHTPRPDHVGAPGLPAYHGGIIAAVMERTAMRVADPAFRPLDIEVRYLAPASARRPLIARATPRRAGRRAATIDVTAWQDDESRPVAVARMLLIADMAGTAALSRIGS